MPSENNKGLARESGAFCFVLALRLILNQLYAVKWTQSICLG